MRRAKYSTWEKENEITKSEKRSRPREKSSRRRTLTEEERKQKAREGKKEKEKKKELVTRMIEEVMEVYIKERKRVW